MGAPPSETAPAPPAKAPANGAPSTRAQAEARRPPARAAIAPQSANGAATRASSQPSAITIPRPVTPDSLTRAWGVVRSESLKTMPWVGPRDTSGRSQDLADALNENPEAIPDVLPTMRLLLRLGADGKHPKARDVLQSPTYGFAVWCSSFTALCEQLHGKAPEPKRPRADDDDPYPEL